MSNKPIKTFTINPKRADGTYIKLGSNATWDGEKWSWSINVALLRETLSLIDSGAIETKNGYIGGKCGIFENKDSIPEVAVKQGRLSLDDFKNDEIPF